MTPGTRRTSFTSSLLALALAAGSAGCASVYRTVEPAQVEADPQALVGKWVRFVDASDRTRRLRVESIRHPILRGTAGGLAHQGAARYVESRSQKIEEVDLTTVRNLKVIEPGEQPGGGEIALFVVEALLRGVVMAGFGLLIVVL